ncbi:MAG: hypothetical protein GYA02_00715 [Clostridiaceae bacterium]|nr:hypothetical protein [Clostridiaceae bacterium]
MEHAQENGQRDRELLLAKAREILESYNAIFYKTFEKLLADLKRDFKEGYEKGKKKILKHHKKRSKNGKYSKQSLDHAHSDHHCHDHVHYHDHDDHFHGDMEEKGELEEFYHEILIKKMHEVKETVYNIWKQSPIDELEGKSVEEFFNGIDDLDLLIEILSIAAVKVSEDIPEILVKKLYTFGEKGIDKVIDSMLNESHIKSFLLRQNSLSKGNSGDSSRETYLSDSNYNYDNITNVTSYLIPLEGIKILGAWKTEKSANSIIDFMDRLHDLIKQNESDKGSEADAGNKGKTGSIAKKNIEASRNYEDNRNYENNEGSEDISDSDVDEEFEEFEEFKGFADPALFGESARDALISIGEPAIRPLLDLLTKTEEYNDYHEYLAMALANIAKDYKSEEIYKCLRKMFRKHNNKIVMADCLAHYGDGRAIPALRGYIEKNIDNVDPDTLYSFGLAIKELGGSMDDFVKDYFQKGIY